MIENISVEAAVKKQLNLLLSPSQREAFIGKLAAGELLAGKVMEILNNHKFLINFKGSKVVAESTTPLRLGQQIQVRVMQTHPQAVMSLITEGSSKQESPSVLRISAESAVKSKLTLLLSASQKETFMARLTSGQLLSGKVEKALSDTTFLINFKGMKVVAESMTPLKPGQQIQTRMVQTQPQAVMNLITEGAPEQEAPSVPGISAESAVKSKLTLLLSASQKETFIARLAAGELLSGKVEKVLSKTTFLLNVKGMKVVAESMTPLKPGQQIQARMVQVQPQVVINLVTEAIPEQKALALIRSYLPLQINWGELIEGLKGLLGDKDLYLLETVVDKELLGKMISSLSTLSFDKDKAGDSEKIKQFIEHSGLLYESKLKQTILSEESSPKHLEKVMEKDLKGLLLKLSQKLEEVSGKQNGERDAVLRGKVEELLKTVNSSIKRIELHQLVNYSTTKNDQQLVLQIPLALPEGIKTAELYIRNGQQRSKKGKGTKENFYIVFLLNMRSLGGLRIDAHLSKKKIDCKIQVDNRETANFITQHLPDLSRRFESLDYKIEKISCIMKKEDSKEDTPLKGFSLLEMKLLDIVI
jgi:hypothetical protein